NVGQGQSTDAARRLSATGGVAGADRPLQRSTVDLRPGAARSREYWHDPEDRRRRRRGRADPDRRMRRPFFGRGGARVDGRGIHAGDRDRALAGVSVLAALGRRPAGRDEPQGHTGLSPSRIPRALLPAHRQRAAGPAVPLRGRMRPARQNPDGGPRRQPQRRDGRRGHGIRDSSKLAMTEPSKRRAVGPRVKKWIALLLVAPVCGCLPPPPPPPPPYHAVGTEPFWNLLIDERNITF